MPISAGISAGGSLLNGIFGSKAANNAAKIQQQNAQQVAGMATTAANAATADANTAATGVTNATNTGVQNLASATANGQNQVAGAVTGANSTLQNYLQQQLAQYQPYQASGTNALNSLASLTSSTGPLSQQFSFNPSDLSKDPGYAFTLQQGQQAIQRSAAAQGTLNNTGTQKSLAGYTEGTANQYFQQSYNNALNTFNTNRQGTLSQIAGLQNLAGLGYGATQGAAGALGTSAGQQSQNTVQGGEYGANLGLAGTQAGAQLGLTGATTAGGFGVQGGQFGLQGAQIAGQALTGGANAQAAGTIGSTNAWLNALNGGTNSLTQYLNYQNGLGVQNGNLANIPGVPAYGSDTPLTPLYQQGPIAPPS